MPVVLALVGSGDAKDALLLPRRPENLHADGQPFGIKSTRKRQARQAGEIAAHRKYVGEIHLNRIVDVLAETKGRRGGGGRDQGVDLPYGCKYGGCITCAAKLTDGDVNQSRQVALNNRQINEGYIILCVARPQSDITLEIGVESHDKLYRNPFLDPLEPHELKADIAESKEH